MIGMVASALASLALLAAAGDGDVTEPHRLKYVPPAFPGINGKVILQAMINTDGSVGEIEVLYCNPDDPRLTESAIRAVRRWRYEPARKDGVPVAVYWQINIDFRAPARYRPPPLPGARALIERVDPVYPAQALEKRAKGKVRVRLVIGTDGRVEQIENLQFKLDKWGFFEAVRNAVLLWEFLPAATDGRTTRSETQYLFRFSAKGGVPRVEYQRARGSTESKLPDFVPMGERK